MRTRLFLPLILLATLQTHAQVASYVNPFVGASTSQGAASSYHGLGKTFPGAATPFGLVQLSPNTITGGDNGPGYSYEHTTIEGFAFTQMSGIGWYGDLGNFLVMPATGPLKTSCGRISYPKEGYRSRYSKQTEKASAGYYAATLTDYNIRAEMTAAPHSGIMRFTFPANKQSRIQVDLARRVGGTSTLQYIRKVDDHTIEGWMKCTPDGGGWGNGDGKANYTVYFHAVFSKPLKKFGTWSADIPNDWTRKREDIESDHYRERVAAAVIHEGLVELTGKHLGFFTEFDTKENEQVKLKAGISFVSIDGARKNLKAEITDWNVERVQQQATDLWNAALSKMTVEGGTKEQKTVFYTALYHTLIDPRAFADVDGKYPGADGRIHQTAKFTKRTIFSGWDVFRSQFPLQTIINPVVVNDMINSLIEMGDESGQHYLERWEFLNAYSGCMVGNPAIAVIADAYAKGIRGFNLAKGYEYAKNSSIRTGNSDAGFSKDGDVISTTLEYAYSDWCMSTLAKALDKKDDAGRYLSRASWYKNIYDDSVHWFRPKSPDGAWVAWPERGRLQQDYGCVESNPYQQGWFVPHDIEGMTVLMGGKEKVLRDLSNFFDSTSENMMWNNYYNHPNEPVHHVPFLFNRLGRPDLTQKYTRKICAKAYKNAVDGLVGNEDVGQMSAWYVLAAAGFHPVCPGDTRYEITSPVFNKIIIRLDPKYASGKTFTIIARNNSTENIYIKSMKLNGKQYTKWYIDHRDIARGGMLEMIMDSKPPAASVARQ